MSSGRRKVVGAVVRRFGRVAQNALELARVGRFGDPMHAPYRVVEQSAVSRLRHYGEDDYQPAVTAPVLLVPPLMLTAEIYDIAPDVSAINALLAAGLDVWLLDFGKPELERGGMKRTLDDHVCAVSDAIDYVHRETQADVHLVGYSQGGMFAYQATAFRRSQNIASLVTFGSPVDIHRNLPNIEDSVAARLFNGARQALGQPLEQLEGLPGVLTSTGFKLLSLRKELAQFVDFVRKLHDRKALKEREGRRRFLAGEGFVAWPGPALRQFIDEFIVHNRMISGGFVIDGRSVTLADIKCPILYFVGERDGIAQPAAVRALERAAPESELHEVSLPVGHFGLVVGSVALRKTWPAVVQWVRWREQLAPRPSLLPPSQSVQDAEDVEFSESDLDFELFYEAISATLNDAWRSLGRSIDRAGGHLDRLRWELPRLQFLRELRANTQVSFSKSLSDQAAKEPEGTFFLWQGRAFSYAAANRRVDAVARGFVECGVEPGDHVGVLMHSRPSMLSAVAALNRLGAVSVLLRPGTDSKVNRRALAQQEIAYLVTDPEHAGQGSRLEAAEVLVLGGVGGQRDLPEGVRDMEAINPDKVVLPDDVVFDAGLSRDLAMIFFTAGRGGVLRTSRVSNGRWAFSAFGAAAACALTSKDTVYCCLPLHHPAGLLVAVSSALVGQARLALGDGFDPKHFWDEVRRYGASVVFYAGEMLRPLLLAEPSAADHKNPVRLFAGSGLRPDVWRKLKERFGPLQVLEFYASTEASAVLANASGEKIGAVGRALPGSAELALVRFNFVDEEFVRDQAGFLVRATTDEPGVLISKLDADRPLSEIDTPQEDAMNRLVYDVFQRGDVWFVSWDVLKQDAQGDYWFVDRVGRILHTPEGIVSTREVEDVFYALGKVEHAAVWGLRVGAYDVPVAVIALADAKGTKEVSEVTKRIKDALPPHARPRFIRRVESLALSEGYRPLKTPLREEGLPLNGRWPLWAYDATQERYRVVRESAQRDAVLQV